jgi:hypothetical protein
MAGEEVEGSGERVDGLEVEERRVTAGRGRMVAQSSVCAAWARSAAFSWHRYVSTVNPLSGCLIFAFFL